MAENNRVVVDCGDFKIVADINTDPNYREVFVGLEDKCGTWIQDLAIVRQQYHYENGDVVHDKGINVKVYADANDEDYTHSFDVAIYEEESEDE